LIKFAAMILAIFTTSPVEILQSSLGDTGICLSMPALPPPQIGQTDVWPKIFHGTTGAETPRVKRVDTQ